MKITVIHRPDEEDFGKYEEVTTKIETQEGEKSVSFSGGEPEDMTISRDLSDAWLIESLLVMAYNAGKNGEELQFEEITVED